MSIRSGALLLAVLVAGQGCGETCPAASQAGDCAQSNVVENAAPPIQVLSVQEGCTVLPLDYCRSGGSGSCVLGGGDDHRFSYILISDQQQWEDLAATIAGANCLPAGVPSNWKDTHLLIATLSAVSSTDADVKHRHFSHANGQPHVVLDFNFVYDESCDCAAEAALALVFSSPQPPSICAKARADCAE